MSDPRQFFTPIVGRMTHGSVTEKRKTDQDNRPIPEADQRFEIGVAFDKNQIWPFLTSTFHPYIAGALANDPNGLQRLNSWFQTLQGFSMKVTDGDKPNTKGQVNENTKGCFVFWFSFIEVKCVAGPNPDALVEISAEEIKRGYYVQVSGNIKPNRQPGDRAGIYLNGNVVWLRAQGEVIAGGVDPSTAFQGAGAAALPPGAQAYDPSSGAGASFGGMPGQSQPPAGMPGGSNPTQPPAGMPGGVPGQPQTGHAGMPAPGGMPGAAPGSTASPSEPQTQPHQSFMSGPPRT